MAAAKPQHMVKGLYSFPNRKVLWELLTTLSDGYSPELINKVVIYEQLTGFKTNGVEEKKENKIRISQKWQDPQLHVTMPDNRRSTKLSKEPLWPNTRSITVLRILTLGGRWLHIILDCCMPFPYQYPRESFRKGGIMALHWTNYTPLIISSDFVFSLWHELLSRAKYWRSTNSVKTKSISW